MRMSRLDGLGVLAGFLAFSGLAIWLVARRAPIVADLPDLGLVLGADRSSVKVLDLGDGFVELVGEVESWGEADEVEEEVAALPGIAGVVNRLWIV